MQTNLSAILRSSTSFTWPPAVAEQGAKMCYAARCLFESQKWGFQVLGGAIKHKINHGTFSLDPAFREQMKIQLDKLGEQANQAGVAGFVGIAFVAIVSILLVEAYKRATNPSNPVSFIKGSNGQPDVTIPRGVRQTLNTLLSTYKIKTIEEIPVLTGEDFPRVVDMTESVMKGVTKSGRPYLAIKIQTDLSKYSRIGHLSEKQENLYRSFPSHTEVLILYRHYPQTPAAWHDTPMDYLFHHSFFEYEVTSSQDGSVLPNAKAGFEAVQNILKGGEYEDDELHGKLKWKLAT